MSSKNENQQLLEMLHDESASPRDRCDMLLFAAAEKGLDYRGAVTQVIEEADKGRKLEKKYQSQGESTVASLV